jgi:integrase
MVPSGQMKGAKTFGFPLSPEAVRVLRGARLLRPRGERVFQYDGKPIENFNTKAFKKAAERAGGSGLRWHDLRHTGASWAVQNGVTLQELMALGGWKSYAMVLRYAHLSPNNSVGAARAVGASVAQALRRRKTVRQETPSRTVA